jgi:assimilatory nitrate reductase catalytic subunit
MTRTGKAPRLGAHLAEPYAEIHPEDAVSLGIASGELIELSNSKGTSILRALITDRSAKRQFFAPMHWTRQQTSAAWVNNLASSVVDPISGQPAAKANKINARKFEAKWFAYGAALHPMRPDCAYSAIARTMSGWQGEFAGIETPESWENLARNLMDLGQGDVSEVRDQNGQQTRLAFYAGDQLIGLFFTSPEPVSLSRSHAVSLIGTNTPPLQALAGQSGADQPDPGTTICACLNVGGNTLRSAIAEGATSVDALGAVTGAGTNCGSCKPELARLLEEFRLPMAAE